MRVIKRYPSVEISHFSTEVTILIFSRFFKIFWKAICNSFEKNKKRLWEKIKGTKMLILVTKARRWLISYLWIFFKIVWKSLGSIARVICKPFEIYKWVCNRDSFPFCLFQSLFLYITYCLNFEHLEDVVMANIWRIKVQFHAMGVIANNVQYWWLVVVICNPKISQPNYDLNNSLNDQNHPTTHVIVIVVLIRQL